MILLENSADLISMIVLNSSHPSTSITSPIHSITRKKDKCTTRETLVTAASHTVHSMESNSVQRLKVNSKKSATYRDLNHSSWCHATFSFSILSLRCFLTYGFSNLSDNWSVMGTFVLLFMCFCTTINYMLLTGQLPTKSDLQVLCFHDTAV